MSIDKSSPHINRSKRERSKVDLSYPTLSIQNMTKENQIAVFLVGCPRSGTTLLQNMLMAHSSITSFPESHFFTQGFGGSRLQRLQKNIKRGHHLYAVLLPWLEQVQAKLRLSPHTLHPAWSRSTIIQQFVDQLDRWTAEQNKSLWVEKTPMHLDHIHQISRYLPDARFIHTIRDGRAVVASLYDVTRKYPEAWGGPRSLEDCVAQWNRCMVLSHRQLNSKQHHFVIYEQLVQSPETVLTLLCSFLNQPFEAGMISHFGKVSKEAVLEPEAWKSRNQDTLKSTGLDLYKKLFSSEQQQQIEASLNMAAIEEIKQHETSI